MVRFVILSDNRAGSHFLQSLLNSHPKINCYWELFWQKDKTTLGYNTYLSKADKSGIFSLFSKNKLVKEFLEHQFSKYKDVKASGFLLKPGNIRRFPLILNWLKDNEVKIIYIIRENSLNHEVALQLRRNCIVTSHSRNTVDFHQVHLNAKGLIKRLRKRKRKIEHLRRKIKGCYVLEVKYEELLTNYDAEIARILLFLKIEQSGELHSEFAKTESENPKEMIVNYDEVKNMLEGTEFEKYL